MSYQLMHESGLFALCVRVCDLTCAEDKKQGTHALQNQAFNLYIKKKSFENVKRYFMFVILVATNVYCQHFQTFFSTQNK